MRALPSPPVMLVTDRKQAQFPLEYSVQEACEAGCRWVSLREKDLEYDTLHALFMSLRTITEKYGALLSVHASAQVGSKLGARAIHLAAHEDVRAARYILGEDCLIGQSCHTVAQCFSLPQGTADYGLLGPMFPTASKPDYCADFERDDVIQLTRKLPFPLLGIGGIAGAELPELYALGLHGFAVMGGIMRTLTPQPDMAALIAAYHCVWDTGRKIP